MQPLQPYTFLEVLSWFEVYELLSTLQKWSLLPWLDESQQTEVFILTISPDSTATCSEQQLPLPGVTMAGVESCFKERLQTPPHEDGECADNDILDILLPLQKKIQIVARTERTEKRERDGEGGKNILYTLLR